MEENLGLVSIVMPAYNCAEFIGESIESVLAQTYENWELLIVNDCSTDNTAEVVGNYIAKDSRIKLFHNEKNSGGALTRNYALREAQGKWIAFLDSDDLWMPEKLEKQVRFMVDNSYDFSYTNYEHINEDGTSRNILITGPKKVTKRMMFRSCYIGCLTVMYNAGKIGLIQIEDTRKRNDYAMWLKVIKKSNCYLLDENLAKYRRGQKSVSSGSKAKMVKHHYYLFRHCEKMNPISASWYTCMNVLFKIIRDKKYKKVVE